MSTSPAASPITLNNPPQAPIDEVLNENPSANAYDPPKLQHGLCRDDQGALRIKPDIEPLLPPERLAVANRLLEVGQAAKANSLLACGLLQKIHGVCMDEQTGEWHDTYITGVACGMTFLCPPCSTPKARLREFRHDHPYLFEHLRHSRFHVLTLTAPAKNELTPEVMASALGQVRRFADTIDSLIGQSGLERGWKFLPAVTFNETTKFFVIYQGGKLPAWPTLNAEWRVIAGPDATIRAKMFDGEDGDDQLDGLRLAYSGFVDYHSHIRGVALVEWALKFLDFDTSHTYGLFRGFDSREEQWRATHALDEQTGEPVLVELCETGEEHVIPVCCLKCGRPIRYNPELPMMTIKEILAKGASIYFKHTEKPIYARCGHAHNGRADYHTLRSEVESAISRAGPS
jgi:hypothetical protein